MSAGTEVGCSNGPDAIKSKGRRMCAGLEGKFIAPLIRHDK